MFPALEANKPKIRRMYKNFKGKAKMSLHSTALQIAIYTLLVEIQLLMD